jgi:exonuclease SbcD
MLKILHTADWHISPDRLDEKIRTISKIIKFANSEKVDLFVIAGDSYDKKPTALCQKTLIQLLQKIEVPIAFLDGNHDSPEYTELLTKIKTKNEFHYLSTLSINPININGIDVYPFPHISKTSIREVWPDLTIRETDEKFVSASHDVFQYWANNIKTSGKPSVVVGHFTTSNVKSASGQTLLGKTITLNNSILDSLNCPVMLGHIHLYQVMGNNVVYSGNPCRTRFDETDEKGFVLWEYDDKWTHKFITTNARELVTINASFDSTNGWTYDQVDIKGKEVKFIYEYHKKDLPLMDFKPVREFLDKSVFYVFVPKEIKTFDVRAESISTVSTPEEMLKVYQKIHGVPDNNENVFKKLNEIVQEVIV